jgi:hypothetical protein
MGSKINPIIFRISNRNDLITFFNINEIICFNYLVPILLNYLKKKKLIILNYILRFNSNTFVRVFFNLFYTNLNRVPSLKLKKKALRKFDYIFCSLKACHNYNKTQFKTFFLKLLKNSLNKENGVLNLFLLDLFHKNIFRSFYNNISKDPRPLGYPFLTKRFEIKKADETRVHGLFFFKNLRSFVRTFKTTNDKLRASAFKIRLRRKD